MTARTRNGTGHRAYRRKAQQLKHRTQRDNGVCEWCGQPFDWTLPPMHAMAFTADHTEAIANGGNLLGELKPMHRACNARKGTHQLPTLRAAT
ncbi:HNH endonuclease [Dermabacter hominis]|uniref:HNH endonuclease n=1 Tax=Dermabacter hominis TaxID=36740 RepID=UPI0024330B5B|nr:HNH endonuclease [Dermabacter hominis]